MIEKDIRMEISERWMQAVDYLIQKGELKSYRDLEEKTGIQNQRITLIKSYIRDMDSNRRSYAHTDYLYHLAKLFNVSLEWLYFGTLPLIKDQNEPNIMMEPGITYSTPMRELQEQMKNLSEKVEKFLDEKG